AAAVHLPGRAVDPLLHVGPLPQREVKRDEIEGGADPADADDEMCPAQEKIQPVSGKNGHGSLASRPAPRRKSERQGDRGPLAGLSRAWGEAGSLRRKVVVDALDVPVHAEEAAVGRRFSFRIALFTGLVVDRSGKRVKRACGY